MSSTNKKLALLLIVQVVLIMGMRLSSEPTMTYETVTVLPGLDPDKVTKVEIWGPPKSGDGPDQNSVVLAKTNGSWGVANADAFPVDATKVKEKLNELKALTSRTKVLESATYHEKLEVSADKFQRKVTVHADGKPTTVYFGTNASFKNTHVRVDGSDAVYLVNDFATSDLGDRAWHWVDREYVKFGAEQVWAVDITNGKGQMKLEKNPVDNMWAALGMTEELDKTTIDDLVRKASSINLDAPVGKTAKPEHGFDAPSATISLVTGTSTIAGTPPPTTNTVTIKVGKKLEKQNQYFVKSSTSEYVVRVPGWAIDPLVNKTKADLIKKEDDKKAPGAPGMPPGAPGRPMQMPPGFPR